MSRFLAASKAYHTKHKTVGSDMQISAVEGALFKTRKPKTKVASAEDTHVPAARKGQISVFNPETGRIEWYSSQAEADKAAFWFNMFTQDKAEEEKKRAKFKMEYQKEMDENSRCKKLRAMAPLVMERRMVGVLAAMEGIRCYHYVKSASETGMTKCDCTKVSPGVFKIADHHKPGTFYVDDRAVNRQIDIMKANTILTGKDLVMNPGGFGQQISESDHIHQAISARMALNFISGNSSSSN